LVEPGQCHGIPVEPVEPVEPDFSQDYNKKYFDKNSDFYFLNFLEKKLSKKSKAVSNRNFISITKIFFLYIMYVLGSTGSTIKRIFLLILFHRFYTGST
jgi:hypothetical protein